MKRIWMLKKSVLVSAVCMAVLCIMGTQHVYAEMKYSKPTPEQVAERTRLLYLAIANDDLEMAKACIETGARLNAGYLASSRFDATALISAASCGLTDMVKLLINAGADVNAKDNVGRTALMYAVSYEYTDIVNLLKAAGARE